jgi:hypothetical protein
MILFQIDWLRIEKLRDFPPYKFSDPKKSIQSPHCILPETIDNIGFVKADTKKKNLRKDVLFS